MAFDEDLAARVREVLADEPDATERRMFGGIAFMLAGNMAVGVQGGDLMARVGPDAHDGALRLPHARPMDFTGRPMKGYVYVAPEGVTSDADLRAWLDRCVGFVRTLPPK